nr:sigma-70 family RNA polymerase sigma factor [Aneurinibacillus sp. XH2]
MEKKSSTIIAFEKGFSRYVNSCLSRASRDYFRRLNREYQRLVPYDENVPEVGFTCKIIVCPFIHVEKRLSLSQAMQSLSPSERKLLYLKFYGERTDKEIANLFGVTRQAITKSKINLLIRLKSYIDC